MNQDGTMHEAVVAITGSGRGIGNALAHRLSASGAAIAVIDKDKEAADATCEQLLANGRESISIVADVSSSTDCERMVAETIRSFGRLDVMICNAGIIQAKAFLDLSEDEWDAIFRVNTRGVFLTIKAAAVQMQRQQPKRPNGLKGKIVTIASVGGRYGAGPMAGLFGHYRASKAAAISIIQTAAQALAPEITVNAVCPGFVESGMWESIDRYFEEANPGGDPQAWRKLIRVPPLGRQLRLDDISELVVFLASSGSNFITGQTINVEGGLTMN